MIVYCYDAETMQFTGATDAFESPLEPGQFLIPANSTEIAPPDFDDATHVCEFNGATWEVRAIAETQLPPDPSPGEIGDALAAELLKRRALLLSESDWMLIRHQDELLAGVEPTLQPDKLKALLTYRQELRDLTRASGFPQCALPALAGPDVDERALG